jgi:hypothetical protein
MNAPVPNPHDCDAAMAVLHRWLDRESIGVPPEVAAHLSACVECRERFAASGQLATAMIREESLPVPPLLTERIVAAVLTDRQHRRRQQWRMAGAALAIAASIAVVIGLAWPSGSSPNPAPAIVKAPEPTGPGVQKEFAEAGEAVASLTRRAATDVAGIGKQLVPPVQSPTWPPDLEPAAKPFEEAGAALADGFEPVTTSARRAARLVWRELAMDDDKK